MDDNASTLPPPDLMSRFGRWLCFMILATVGMGAIGLSILAEPVATYYADQASVAAHQKRLDSMRQFNGQLEELLQNAGQPAVVERAAINNLRYIPEEALIAKGESMPKMTPRLEKALTKVTQAEEMKAGDEQQFFETLASHHVEQTLLLVLGSGLVVVSLTFFNRIPQPR
jgi:hypothetical protein